MYIPFGKPIEDWDPAALGHRLDNLAEVIIIDEACKVLNCGEHAMGRQAWPHLMLQEWAGNDGRTFETDYRCLCEISNEPWFCYS